jgi:hypothetical protein
MIRKKSQIWSWLNEGTRGVRDPVVVRRGRRMRPELILMEARTLLSTFTVTSTADDASKGTLRWAVEQANSDNQANTIVFSPTVFATPKTITLKSGQLSLRDTTGTQTIVGPAAGVTISADHR